MTRSIETSAYEIAQVFIGTDEVPGKATNPQILAMLQLDDAWPTDDEVPWCSAFVNYIAFLLKLSRSKSLRARSWLEVGAGVMLERALVGFDVVILKRGTGEQPGPEVINAPGHVGFFSGYDADQVFLLGGNQGDSVTVVGYPRKRLLGVRRLI